MAKAKTDPAAPSSVLRLLSEIEAVKLSVSQDAPSSSSSETTGLIQQVTRLLSRCLDLTFEASNELEPSFKYGLDALRLWATHTTHLLKDTPLPSADESTRASLFPPESQLRLANVIWSSCHSERTQVSSRCKAVLESIIALLDVVFVSTTPSSASAQKSTQNDRSPTWLVFPSQAIFLTTLVERSLSQLERRQSPIILETMMNKYGSAPFLNAQKAGLTLNDQTIYERMIRGLGTVDGGANRRSRLALSFISARAHDLGCDLSSAKSSKDSSNENTINQDSSQAWSQWTQIWVRPLTSALQDGGERLRSGLASYHLSALYELDNRVFGTLLDSLMSPQRPCEINVESVFLVLRTGKVQGHCLISPVVDFVTEMRPDGSRQVLIPAALLQECILSAASELQISALSLVIESKTPALPLSLPEYKILQTFFPYSLTISTPAARGELRGFFVKLLTRLRASTYALARDIGKITRIKDEERFPEEKQRLADLQRSLDASESFLKWMFGLVRTTLHPGASYQACITALTFLDLMLDSGVDPRFSPPQQQAHSTKSLTKNAGMSLSKSKMVFTQGFPFALDLISPSLVNLLLACSESTYDDIQVRALTMLASFPAPLAGLETEEAAARRILGRAAELMTSTRDFESSAAAQLIQLYRQIYMQQLGHRPASLLSLVGVQHQVRRAEVAHPTLALVFDLFDFLSYQLKVAESGKILEAATSHPVHGTLVTLQELFSSLSVSGLSQPERALYKAVVEEAEALIDRTWTVTSPILCNSAPEGSAGDAAEESATDGTAGLDQPTHETARAMRVADDDSKAELMQSQEESNAGPKHQVILSYSWRGMKEASALLGSIVASTLAKPQADRRNKAATDENPSDARSWRDIYDIKGIQKIGSRFNLWLTQIRHRGAFSTIYPAYCDAASSIVRSQDPEIELLPKQWITAFLDRVAEPGSKLSITRRSAGIGYAVLALVSAQPNKKDASILHSTVQRLIEISNQDAENLDEMPVASIHALNILRILVMDGDLSDFMSPFLGTLLEITISKFKSHYWGLRNVSMMLFSSLCIKIFGSRNTNKDKKDARIPVEEFFASYPKMDSFFRRVLQDEISYGAESSEGAESSTFAILMLFSRMQAPEAPQTSVGPEKVGMQACREAVLPYLSHRVWKIREVASKAYAAFVPLTEAAKHAGELLEHMPQGKQNSIHGTLLAVKRLIKSVAEAEAPLSAFSEDIAYLTSIVHRRTDRLLESNPCLITRVTFLEVVQELAGLQHDPADSLGSDLLKKISSWLEGWLTITQQPAELDRCLQSPGGPALLGVCTRTSLQLSLPVNGESHAVRFVTICDRLIRSPASDVRLSVLEALVSHDGLPVLFKDAPRSSSEISALVQILHDIVKNDSEGIWQRVHASETLFHLAIQLPSSSTSLVSCLSSSGLNLEEEALEIARITRTTTCVPLREALVPYLATLCGGFVTAASSNDQATRAVERCAEIITSCADEYQSVQSREAAALAAKALGRVLFPSSSPSGEGLGASLNRSSSALFNARIAAINLLTDDDEDVRIEAAAMIGETVSPSDLDVQTMEAGAKRAAMQVVARRGGASPDVSTDRAWQWMTRHYSEKSGPNSHLWTRYVWDLLVPSQADLDKAFDEAFSENTVLFAEEKPNQFRDVESIVRRAAAFANPAHLSPSSREQILSRTVISLKRLGKLLDNNTKFEAISTHMLATRLLLALQALTKAPGGQQDGPDTVDTSILARSIADRLCIDVSTFSSTAPASMPSRGQDRSEGCGTEPRYNIAMVSDFFFPNVGGVEGHIYFVGERLLARGHKVIVITHAYAPDRVGVRYLSNGLKVYYVPYQVIARQDTLPNFFSLFPSLRSILIREEIQIVHSHQALSSMAHEGILHARSMGLRTVFSDHSLFGFADSASILTNKLIRFALSDVDAVVCVSHTGKENTTLRAHLDPNKVYVIPNAVVAEQFAPDPTQAEKGSRLTVVVLSRLMYRKGIDLLIAAIPRLCAAHPELHFLVGGDGPKRIPLEQMRERYMLQDRVELCGTVRQGDVRAHLTRGSIFLNTSLTEAFGTGIIEAACAGLFVVSTKVGGIPEVLPPEMIRLAKPEEDDIVRAMEDAISYVQSGAHDPVAYHEAVKSMYSWDDVARRLEKVYTTAIATDFPRPIERFRRYYSGGPVAGKIFCIIVAVDLLFLKLLQWWLPESEIDRCPSFVMARFATPGTQQEGKRLDSLIPADQAEEVAEEPK